MKNEDKVIAEETYYTVRHGIHKGTATTIRLEHKVANFTELAESLKLFQELAQFKGMLPQALPLVGIGYGPMPSATNNAPDLGDKDLMKRYKNYE